MLHKVRAAKGEAVADLGNDDVVDLCEKRRKVIFRAGFEDLSTGSDDERVQRLHLSLAVMSDACVFTRWGCSLLSLRR